MNEHHGERKRKRLMASHVENREAIVIEVETESTPRVWPLFGPKNHESSLDGAEGNGEYRTHENIAHQ